MAYLNNAATTYPKPEVVKQAVARSLDDLPTSQYRGTVGNDIDCVDWEKLCRENLARLFQIKEKDRIVFTSGSTQALNMAILGVCRSGIKRHGIVITATEHNAVLRTIYDGLKHELESGELYVRVVPCDKSGYVDLEEMDSAIDDDTALVIVNHVSNVTGAMQDVNGIGQICRSKGALFLVDASQSAGVVPISVEELEPDFLAFTAHKSLFGIQGCGGLYINPQIELRPIMFGGTGTNSEVMVPEKPFYQVGTANIPGIAGLCAGVGFVLENGIDKIMQKDEKLMGTLYEGLKSIEKVVVYADKQPCGAALSFNIEGLSSSDVGYILSGSYGIQTRTGLHCAPFIHEYLGSGKMGTVRVSVSYLTEEKEIYELLDAVKEITKAV